jgi:hypothetical protein
MTKCIVQTFVDDNQLYWVCPNTIGRRTPRKASVEKCWKYNCPGRANLENNTCFNSNCSNPKKENSRYCSVKCRKRKNSADYRKKKKDAL